MRRISSVPPKQCRGATAGRITYGLRNYPMCSVARVSDEFTVPLCHTHHRETIAALMKYCGGGKPE
jgi:hypothetical protein